MKEIDVRPKLVFALVLFVLLVVASVFYTGVNYQEELINNTSQDVRDFLVEVSNGDNKIEPLKFHCSAYRPVTEEDNFFTYEAQEGLISVVCTDGLGIYNYDMVENLSDIPAINLSSMMNLSRSNTTSISYIDIYNSNAIVIKDNVSSWSKIPKLDAGQYFIVIGIHNELTSYYENAQFLFTLYV